MEDLMPDVMQRMQEKLGLLMSSVSARVIEKARRNKRYLEDLEAVSAAKGSLNIEMLISLIENSKIYGWESKARKLKYLVKQDIERILTRKRTRRFYLHKALFELHQRKATRRKERLIGLISLNYDDVLGHAYRTMLGRNPSYCLSLEQGTQASRGIPLLKLHGSFNWGRQNVRGRIRNIEIIPLGLNKSYLHAPYGSIWNRAMEVLADCDTLRVIGCSLSQNDVHLIDLLFKAHLERGSAFDIEVISPEDTGEQIQRNYGFFPSVKRLTEIEGGLEGGLVAEPKTTNAFKTWLKYKALRMIGSKVDETRHLKKVVR
jgi:hypothetical protein